MVHSGSRNFGKKFYDHYKDVAIKLGKMWYSPSEIPFLPIHSKEGQECLSYMDILLQFAFLNRRVMIDDIIKDITHYFPHFKNITQQSVEGVGELINIHHNYASLENHMGKDLLVHRKGAVLARKGTIGIIPGSQSTFSFITIGNGNPMSLNSSSHGSGRKMGRKEFNLQNQSRVKEIEEEMKNKGICYSKFQKSTRGRDNGLTDISESGDAYKDVIQIMNNQIDLVTPLVKLSPIINWKG